MNFDLTEEQQLLADTASLGHTVYWAGDQGLTEYELTITGSNTFTTIANGVQPTTFTFTAGTTTTVTNWNVSGTAGNLVTIGSATAVSFSSKSSSVKLSMGEQLKQCACLRVRFRWMID